MKATIEERDGEAYLVFPEELVQKMGWKEGTWIDLSVDGRTLVVRTCKDENDVPPPGSELQQP